MQVRGPSKTALIATELMLILLGLLVMVLHTPINILAPAAYDLHGNTGHDFRLLYSAAHVLSLHRNPYDSDTFLHQAAQDGLPKLYLLYRGKLNQPFVYPPVFAWGLIPLTLLGPVKALVFWRSLSVALVFLGSICLIRAWDTEVKTGLLHPLFAQVLLAAVIALAPLTTYAIYWGNPVVLVYAAMGGWIYALCKRHPWWDRAAGALMCMGLLKPQLALPLAVLAVACLVRGGKSQRRLLDIAGGFVASIILLLILDILVTPPLLLLAWPKAIGQLSQMIGLQPDMPSLFGLIKSIVPQVSGYSAVYIGITLAGSIVTIVLYIYLRDVWQPMAVLGILTVLWCFTTPYAHGNDQLLLVPGGISLLTAYHAGYADRASTRSQRYHPLLFQALQLLSITALAVLWLGSLPILLHYHRYSIPSVAVTLAPLLLLSAFTATRLLFPSVMMSPTHVTDPMGGGTLDIPRTPTSARMDR